MHTHTHTRALRAAINERHWVFGTEEKAWVEATTEMGLQTTVQLLLLAKHSLGNPKRDSAPLGSQDDSKSITTGSPTCGTHASLLKATNTTKWG